MSPEGGSRGPAMGDVASAVGEAASALGGFVNRMIDEQPGAVLAGAAAVGFLAAGGLNSRLGSRVTVGTMKATVGNLTALVALDLLRRAVENGGTGADRSAGTD
jgi:hypothetical protein